MMALPLEPTPPVADRASISRDDVSMRALGASLEVRVLNRMHVAAAFGENAADAVERAVADRIQRFWQVVSPGRVVNGAGLCANGDASVEIAGEGLYRVDLFDAVLSASIASLVEDLSKTLALEAFAVGDHRIHIAPSVCVRAKPVSSGHGDDKGFNAVASDVPFAGEPVLNDSGWTERYRGDMSVAARLLGELKAGVLSLALQPIRMADWPSSLLYQEGLLRGPDEAGITRPLGLDLIALERLGLVRALDGYVMWRAIEHLRANPASRLGVNISAQSACLDGWWSALEAGLEADRGVAERLTIEITETSTFPSISAATAFRERMRALGCPIALDDFGAGRDAIRNLYVLRPDIVKIDAFFLRQARNSAQGQAALNALVSFAGAIGGLVVVEGVETKADSDAAIQAGAAWQQGFFIDPPRRAAGDDEAAVYETRPAFGRRPSPPPLACVDDVPRAAFAGAGHAIPCRPHFELHWVRWAIPLATLLWALIAGAVWLGWSGIS
ncbi:EAL domain-containing protein [Sinorhizobium meliloti]|nr:EAL domain-containing protein [Sinorhizobium meliloti]MDW9918501.1 EAL domain-containing protein [Sinorhizobium meliloti]MDW9949647.1 EAL domain-containing protein [Sinorhizobium meliloti]